MNFGIKYVGLIAFIFSLSSTLYGQPESPVTRTNVSRHITVLQAGGGNIVVSHGDDGIFVIDSGFNTTSDKVKKAIKEISKKPVKLLINTHWHYDHVGGNETFAKNGAVIMAHENARTRMKNGAYLEPFNMHIDPANAISLPVITLDHQAKVHLNGDTAHIISLTPAHTDGDVVVKWETDNVLHTGDLFFNGFWPFIDYASGGSIEGMVRATATLLGMVDEDTKIIPGHGPLAKKADLQRFHDMLATVLLRKKKAELAGKTLNAWLKENPLQDLDPEWGDGFLSTEKFIQIIYKK